MGTAGFFETLVTISQSYFYDHRRGILKPHECIVHYYFSWHLCTRCEVWAQCTVCLMLKRVTCAVSTPPPQICVRFVLTYRRTSLESCGEFARLETNNKIMDIQVTRLVFLYNFRVANCAWGARRNAYRCSCPLLFGPKLGWFHRI
jgi:hypothetical protein